MTTIQSLFKEMQEEASSTRKTLSRIPNEHFNWQPHPKSMTIKQLATHIAELPTWVSMVLHTNELDFATSPYNPAPIQNNQELMEYFEKCLQDGHDNLSTATEADLLPIWTLRNGTQILSVRTKAEVIRMTYCQIVHHRAQMGVNLRLLNIPVPGSYGPSADEHSM